MNTSKGYRRYLILSENDRKWGFYINNLGTNSIKPGEPYPSKGHPGSYMFNWKKGRVLDEYHFVLISEGEGIFESSETGKKKITRGDAFLLFPNVWHRYKPIKTIGWKELWVGFSGPIARQFFTNGFFTPKAPIVQGCNSQSIINHFNMLFKLFEIEPYGYQRLASGICMQLMAESYNIQQSSNSNELYSMVSQTKHLMYKHINEQIDLKKIASELGVSYSKFRIDFKKHTGNSPLQYFLSLKIEKAKELLLNSTSSQKEIAYSLGFELDYYFCRLFKQKTGDTPKQYRIKNQI